MSVDRQYRSVKNACVQLGVSRELLQGLVGNKSVEGFQRTTRTGNPQWFIYQDEVDRLLNEMRRR